MILAIELLLFEFKSRSFIPLVVASTLATAVHVRLLGGGPMFSVAPVDFGIPRALPFYLLLGVICGFAAVAFSKLPCWVEDQFEKLPIDELWWPAIGALGLGIIGYFVPRVLGGAYAMVINRIDPGAQLASGAFALVAMGAAFGAASRATFTFIIFAFEITRDYNSVLPLMLVSVIADGIAMVLMPKSSIMTEKLARRGMQIHTDYETDALQQITVAEMMDREVPAISIDMSVGELAEKIARRDPAVIKHQGLLILDAHGSLAGVITRSDILRAFEKDADNKDRNNEEMSVLDAGTRDVTVTYPDELLHDAAAKMLRRNIGRLPVVERADPSRVVGYLGRQGILAARLRRLDEEHVREPGWASRFSGRRAAR